MKLETFKKILDNIRKRDELINKLGELGFDLSDNPIIDTVIGTEELFFITIYGEEGMDWVYWYLYEQPEFQKKINEEGSKPEYHAWDADGNPMDLSTDEKIWEMLEKDYGNGV